MKIPFFVVLLLCLLSRAGYAADPFYTNLSKQIVAQGLPVPVFATGDSEDTALSAFNLTYLSGMASKETVTVSGLPFTQGLRVRSETAPDWTWHHFLQRPGGTKWSAGDVGLLVFSVHRVSEGAAALGASVKGADDPYPFLANLSLTPGKTWTTVYVPFAAPADIGKANIGFFFGSTRQILELGGAALVNFGKAVTLDTLKAAILKLPTALPSSANGTTDADTRFAFLTPWDESKPNFLDLSSLNNGPAGSHGFIVVRNGHFAETNTGRRVRFLGTNLGLDGLFPSHEDADKLAAHLAKYGMNLVRLHHEDATWVGEGSNLWDYKFPDHRHISPVQLEKMDYLVSALEKKGIYIDLCLHVSRKFTPADGFPESVSKIPFPFDKRVDEFDPQMIAADKEYFRDLITHVNPYTGKTYAADPGLLDMEINNENSLMGQFGDTPGSGLGGLPDPYGKELTALWNDWLVKKYVMTNRLAGAWRTADATTGPNLYPPSASPAQWTLEVQPGAAATLKEDEGGVRVDVTKVDNTNWHVQLYQKGLSLLKNGMTYTLTFQIKADSERDQSINANLNHAGYDNLGLSGTVHVTPQWQTVSLSFTAKSAEDGQNRLPSLILGTQVGATWLRNIVLKTGVGAYMLPASQTLEAHSVNVEPPGQGAARTDWLSFLAQTESSYVASMRSYLRKDLGVKSLIYCSQLGFGGLWSNYREAGSDYADAHGYWDYHDTLSEPITNQPMVRSLGLNDALSTNAWIRTAGQPMTITEYNLCFPNEYRAETMPGLASFAAFQDWDALVLYTHGGYGARGAQFGQLDRMQFSLEASVDPALWGFMPSAALMFRGALVPSAPSVQTLGMPAPFPAARVAAGLTIDKAWQALGADPLAPFRYRVEIGLGKAGALPSPAAPAGALRVQTADPQTARYVADAPAAKSVFGFVGGQTIALSGATFTFGHLTNRFAALTLTAMDNKPLAQSARALLTLVTHTQNTGQMWNVPRTQLTYAGDGPPLVDGASAAISLAADGPRTVYALDGFGERQAAVPCVYKNGQVTFAVTPAQKTIWYAITK